MNVSVYTATICIDCIYGFFSEFVQNQGCSKKDKQSWPKQKKIKMKTN